MENNDQRYQYQGDRNLFSAALILDQVFSARLLSLNVDCSSKREAVDTYLSPFKTPTALFIFVLQLFNSTASFQIVPRPMSATPK